MVRLLLYLSEFCTSFHNVADTLNLSLFPRFWRSTGTFLSIVLFAWRYAHYPSSYPRIEEPLTVFFFVAAEVMDLIYPFVYSRIESMERSKSK